jgi:hypothetical protein
MTSCGVPIIALLCSDSSSKWTVSVGAEAVLSPLVAVIACPFEHVGLQPSDPVVIVRRPVLSRS